MRLVTGVFFVIFVAMGLGLMASDRSLLDLCIKGCAINSIFFVFFGDSLGKILAGIVSILFGVGLLCFGFWNSSDGKDYYADEENGQRHTSDSPDLSDHQNDRHKRKPKQRK